MSKTFFYVHFFFLRAVIIRGLEKAYPTKLELQETANVADLCGCCGPFISAASAAAISVGNAVVTFRMRLNVFLFAFPVCLVIH